MQPNCLLAVVQATPAPAKAAPGATTNSFPWAGLLVVVAIVCFATRKRSIGGWLLFFLYQVSVQALYSIVMLADWLRNSSHPSVLARYLILNGVSLLCAICLLAVSAILIVTRDPAWVRRLGAVLAAIIVIRGIVLLVNSLQLRSSSPSDILSLVFLVIYYGYFSRSERIRRVFVTKDWGQKSAQSASA
jgi:hypothetical protein